MEGRRPGMRGGRGRGGAPECAGEDKPGRHRWRQFGERSFGRSPSNASVQRARAAAGYGMRRTAFLELRPPGFFAAVVLVPFPRPGGGRPAPASLRVDVRLRPRNGLHRPAAGPGSTRAGRGGEPGPCVMAASSGGRQRVALLRRAGDQPQRRPRTGLRLDHRRRRAPRSQRRAGVALAALTVAKIVVFNARRLWESVRIRPSRRPSTN